MNTSQALKEKKTPPLEFCTTKIKKQKERKGLTQGVQMPCFSSISFEDMKKRRRGKDLLSFLNKKGDTPPLCIKYMLSL